MKGTDRSTVNDSGKKRTGAFHGADWDEVKEVKPIFSFVMSRQAKKNALHSSEHLEEMRTGQKSDDPVKSYVRMLV